jgi:hypothetical protein
LGEARQREELEEWERETGAKEQRDARDKVVADRAVVAYIARHEARAEAYEYQDQEQIDLDCEFDVSPVAGSKLTYQWDKSHLSQSCLVLEMDECCVITEHRTKFGVI